LKNNSNEEMEKKQIRKSTMSARATVNIPSSVKPLKKTQSQPDTIQFNRYVPPNKIKPRKQEIEIHK